MTRVTNVYDLGIKEGKRVYRCDLENDGSPNSVKFFLFKFYDDELTFTFEELIGKTEEECFTLFQKKDVEYLQS